jgi:hypothetical protein
MRHVANLKNSLFNKINFLIMKKVIISTLFLFSTVCGVWASNGIPKEKPKFKENFSASVILKSFEITKKLVTKNIPDRWCATRDIPICSGITVVGWTTVTFCFDNPYDLADALYSFGHC